jgi:multidrug transporter EmrE-like cation transporter
VTALALALVLASAVIHAAWNLWTKQIGATARPGTLMWLLVTLSAALYALPALALWRATGWRPDATAWALVLASGAIHVVYFLTLLTGYRHGDLSVVYPAARGSGPLLASLASLALFGERATPLTFVGLGGIVVGVLVLAGRPAGGSGPALGAGLRWGLATGALIASYTLLDGWAVKRAGLPPLLFYWMGELVRVVLFTPSAARDRAGVARLWREHRGRVLGIAALSPLSYILILIALRTGPVSHIAPAREVSILVGAWLGGAVLGEGERRRRLAAAAAFATGVIALALA